MKRILAMLLVVVITLGLIAGCGGKEAGDTANSQGTAKGTAQGTESNLNPTGFPIVKEKITLKMMGPKAAIQTTWDKMDVFVKLDEMTNVHFVFDTPPMESYQEKKSIIFASNELPDVFFGRDSIKAEDEAIYGPQGLLISLGDLIDKYGPNLKSTFEKTPSIKKAITNFDGKIYSLPIGTDLAMNLTGKIWINSEWIANCGLQAPQTTDDLYQILKAFKEKDPNKNGKADELPMSYDKNSFPPLRNGILSAYGYTTNNVEAKNDKVVYVPAQPEYKEYLAFMNKLYKDGLIDVESFSQTSQQLTAKGNEGRVGLFSSAGPFLVVKVEDNDKYTALAPLTSSVNSTKVWPKSSEVTGTAFAITNKNKYPEATMRWIDYLYSEEGAVLMHNGIEGKHWQWTDANKTKWKRIKPDGINPEEFRGSATPNAGTGTPEIWPKSFAEKQDDALNAFIRKEVKDKYEPYWKESFPSIRFSTEETKKINTVQADLKTYVEQMEAKFIMGNEPLTNWDSYVNNLKKMGLDDMMKIYEDGYQRWKQIK